MKNTTSISIMPKSTSKLLSMFVLSLASINAIARENIDQPHLKKSAIEIVLSGCSPATTQTELAINNVRTTILTGGDMWWNLLSAKYEVPKGGGANALFAGSLWIGGIDAGNQLKVAAMTYRQNGNDFWPGPLDTSTVDISAGECAAYDKHFKITRKEVEKFIEEGTITQNIINWPGNGNTSIGQGKYLAPFYDKDGNGIYDPSAGDYPKYSMDSRVFSCDDRQIFGDETLWWVFNDKGNVHTESDGNSIGLEIRAQAFAFTSTDEVNNMTFYDYEVINRSSIQLNKTFFGVWVDADLGYAFDDYVGCDVTNGIGYCYNGNSEDGTGSLGTYGSNPPAIGVDFFRGPKAAMPGDGVDSLVSFVEPNGRISMAKFVYYNNDFTVQGNPTTQTHYYNYLSGKWKDGTPFTYGGNAKNGSTVCAFMFPGNTDPSGKGTQNVPQSTWDEITVGNPVGDRRFLQSAGPFTLKPGAVNNVTIGCVWARATQGGPFASVQLMRDADVKAQALFNSCFKITNGPDAPDLTIQELDKQLIIYLTNKATSNNYKEGYSEKDPFISTISDSLYKFEGYLVYQVSDSNVSVAELSNVNKARLIFRSDVKNGVKQIVNYEKNASLGGGAWVPVEKVDGNGVNGFLPDEGIRKSFVIDKDMFAKGDNKLINHKKYFFLALAYGYNPGEISADPYNRLDGLNAPYIPGRRNIPLLAYSGIPHNISPEAGGTEQHSNYGDGVQLTRIEGQGNGGRILDLSSYDNILNTGVWGGTNPNGGRAFNVTYERGKGPINIKVIDPLSVPSGCFTIAISDSTGSARWTLRKSTSGAVVATSDTTLMVGAEQIIPELGISINASYVSDIGSPNAPGYGGIMEATMTFADPLKNWLSSLPDVDGTTAPWANLNWIRSGKTSSTPASPFDDYFSGADPIDGSQNFEKILAGTWAPYRLCAYSDVALNCTGGPAWDKLISQNDIRKTLASVDIVFTSDKTKWTRCPVLEMAEETAFAEGGARKMDLRNSPSIDKNGNKGDGATWSTNPDDPGYIAPTGMGWFPGYAINVETGERLNMAYGEDSGLPLENGRDMIWNPTSSVFSSSGTNPIFGGKHYIYVFAHSADLTPFSPSDAILPNGPKSLPRYDGGLAIWALLNTVKTTASNNNYKRVVYVDAMWVNIPLLSAGHQLLESDVKVRLRVSRKFRKGFSGFYGATAASQAIIDTISPSQNMNYPMYSFCTSDLEAHKGENVIAKNALDLINVVPNPYYAFGYEKSQAEKTVKITNLPEKCTLRIYTLNGTLIRTFNKDNPQTSLDWNLENEARIAIASGLYIIHIDAPGVGEKILKWFGVMRPMDLDSY